jgi:hypothetical protein
MSDVKRFKLKALQLLSTEQGAKAAGEVFEKNATDEEVALGVALGLYEVAGNSEFRMLNAETHPLPLPARDYSRGGEQASDETEDGETEDGGDEGETHPQSLPDPVAGRGPAGEEKAAKKKKGGKKQ